VEAGTKKSEFRREGQGVNCPHCGSPNWEVTNVWLAGQIVRRRHKCLGCGRAFHTREVLEAANPRGRPRKIATGSNKTHCHVKKG